MGEEYHKRSDDKSLTLKDVTYSSSERFGTLSGLSWVRSGRQHAWSSYVL